MGSPIHPLEEELALTPVELGGRSFPLWQVVSMDTLMERMLAQDAAVGDDDIPYYACLWPSALVLARNIAEGPSLAGVRVLELGCGVGLSGLAAAVMGADVLMTDLQPAALELVMRNALSMGVEARVRVAPLDWRTPGNDVADIVLCSDVLYEARFVAPLLHAVRSLMAPDGVTLLADPSRPYGPRFLEDARASGLTVSHGPEVAVAEGGAVKLTAVRWRAGGRSAPWDRG